MPEIVALAGIALLGTGGITIGVVAFVIKAVTWYALSLTASKLFGPKIPDMLADLKGISVMQRSGTEYRNIVYGQAATSGPIIYNNVQGSTGEYLWFGVALCDGEIEDLVSVYLDGDAIPKADISWSAGASGAQGAGTGDVSTSTFIGDNSVKAVMIQWTLGHADQLAPKGLDDTFTQWTSNHRCRGVSVLTVRLLYNENTEKLWQRGVPQNIRAVVKGRKIYDPRLDSTQVIDDTTSPLTYGSGSHRAATASTWAWSSNPALCVADYMMNYMGVSSASIDWVSVANAADDCDVQVVVPPAASPSNYETRFTCNGVLSLGQSHKDNLDAILSSFDGKLTYVGGQWRVRASVWEASSVSIDEDDLAGPIDVRGSSPKSERFNTVRGVFVDPARTYEPVEFPHITNSTYVTRDNAVEIEYDLQLPMTNSATMAQRVAFRLLEQANNQIVVNLTTNLRGAKIAVGDVISLTVSKLSWSSKTFRVIEWERKEDGTFGITAREDASSDYDDPTVTDYIDSDTAVVTPPGEVVPPPTVFSASSVPYGIRLNWTNPATMEFDYIDIYASDTSAWSGASRIASVRTDTYTHSVGASTVRYYWIRARRNNGDVSVRAPNSDTSTVTATAGAGTDSVNLVGATLSDQQVAAVTEVGYRFTTGGIEQKYEGVPTSPITWSNIATWLINGSAANFSVRLTKISGTDPTTGTLTTIQPLSSNVGWSWQDSTQDDSAVSFSGTVELLDNTTSPNTVLASAQLSVTIDSQTPAITLSGTSGSPNVAFDSDTTQADSGFYFRTDGTVDKREFGATTQFNAATEWNPGGTGTYYIRATANAGSNPTSGMTLGTWYDFSVDRWLIWTDTTLTGGAVAGSVKIEISTTTSPPGIVATGYYGGNSIREV